MKTIVVNPNDTWSSLICPNCNHELDNFHSECNFNDDRCANCGIDLETSDYQKEYEEQCEEIEKEGINNDSKNN